MLRLLESAPTHELFFASFFLVVAVVGPWIAQRVIGGVFRRVLRKLDVDLVESAIQAVKGPLAIYIFVTFAVLSIDQFEHIPKGLHQFVSYTETVLNGIAILVFAFRVVDISAILNITNQIFLFSLWPIASTYTPGEKNFQAHNALVFSLKKLPAFIINNII